MNLRLPVKKENCQYLLFLYWDMNFFLDITKLIGIPCNEWWQSPHPGRWPCHSRASRWLSPDSGQTGVCDILGSYTLHRLLSPPIRARLWSGWPMRTRGLSSLTSLLHAQPVFNAVQSYARSLYNSARCIFRHDYIITVHRIVRIHSVFSWFYWIRHAWYVYIKPTRGIWKNI